MDWFWRLVGCKHTKISATTNTINPSRYNGRYNRPPPLMPLTTSSSANGGHGQEIITRTQTIPVFQPLSMSTPNAKE